MLVNAKCLCCDDADAVVSVNVNTGRDFTCESCNSTFTLSDVEKVIATWTPLLPWLKSHPAAKQKTV